MTPRALTAAALLSAAILAVPGSARAQFGSLKKAAERAAESEANRQVDKAVRNTIRCAVDDPACAEKAQKNGDTVVYTDAEGEVITDESGNPVSDREAAKGVAEKPGSGVWVNYDFVPGDKVIFAEDYGKDQVGDFPRRLEFVRGNWEVAEWEGRRLLRNTGPRGSAFKVMLPDSLPERFTIEFDAFFTHGNHQIVVLTEDPGQGRYTSQYPHHYLAVNLHTAGIAHAGRNASESRNQAQMLMDRVVPVRLMADGRYVKVYIGDTRVANIPNADLPRGNALYFENVYSASQKNPIYIGPIRVAAGGKDLYDKLAADGRVATRGILFDVDSDRIRPESTPTLTKITQMLQEHPDLRLAIEGHTDATGDDGHNQELSERRAQAVRRWLVEEQAIDGSRLEAKGYGESRPVGSNDTAEGRQNNRRVELVKM